MVSDSRSWLAPPPVSVVLDRWFVRSYSTGRAWKLANSSEVSSRAGGPILRPPAVPIGSGANQWRRQAPDTPEKLFSFSSKKS